MDSEFHFHRPLAFWLGCIAVAAGVLLHLPMFIMAAPMHFHLAGMPMDAEMLVGMGLISGGVLLAGYGLMPRARPQQSTSRWRFHVADDGALRSAHWALAVALLAALVVDVMKPASLAFVMPGVSAEYAISMSTAGWLALAALVGTAIGSLVWGRLADIFGRRATILLSAIMFMGTAICGTMPVFGWNLVMCFLMGAAAGGMLPVAFTLMAETVPAAHRGWLLVALGGIGSTTGYLAAAGAATLLEPDFSWRSLWLLNLPTGALIVFLNRYIPESPRFLAHAGMHEQARAVLARFAGHDGVLVDSAPATAPKHTAASPMLLLRGRHARITTGLATCGLMWGLVNFGFLLWLPDNLARLGMAAHAANALLARSALLAIPGIVLVVWLYQRWSSLRSLVLLIVLTALSLAAFGAIGYAEVRGETFTIAATVALLVSSGGVIATMLPYAAEIYPVHLRGTGSGLIAASTKAGGILGAGLGVLGAFGHFALSALAIALPMAAAGVLLARAGIETRGQGLESIQQVLSQDAE